MTIVNTFTKATLDKIKLRMEADRIKSAHNQTARFICNVCQQPELVYSHINPYAYHIDNDGGRCIIGIRQSVVADQVITDANAFVVCGEKCRKQFISDHGWLYFNTIMEGVELPGRLPDRITLLRLTNDSNRHIIEAIHKTIPDGKGYFIQGIPGSGKSLTSAALAYEYRKREMSIKFVTYKQLHFALFSHIDIEKHINSLVYRDNDDPWDVVILDDACSTFPGMFGKERMTLLFDEWYNLGTIMIMTSNESMEVVGGAIADRVLSRMKEIMNIVPMPDVDYREQR